MEAITFLLDFILHIDVHLAQLVAQYGVWIYAILFLIIFCETGLVVTPFLPGDSLLFVAGALAAMGKMDIHMLVLLLTVAGILGNTTNYTIGKLLGARLTVLSPLMQRSKLDLPEPDKPISTQISPLSMSRLAFSTPTICPVFFRI